MNPQLAMLVATLSVTQLRQLADAKEASEKQMANILGGNQLQPATTAPTSGSGAAGQVPAGVATAQPTKRTMSPAARKAISLKAKQRWAKINAGKKKGKKATGRGTLTANGRRMSPEARARIAAAQKARWAKAKGTAAPAAPQQAAA